MQKGGEGVQKACKNVYVINVRPLAMKLLFKDHWNIAGHYPVPELIIWLAKIYQLNRSCLVFRNFL